MASRVIFRATEPQAKKFLFNFDTFSCKPQTLVLSAIRKGQSKLVMLLRFWQRIFPRSQPSYTLNKPRANRATWVHSE